MPPPPEERVRKRSGSVAGCPVRRTGQGTLVVSVISWSD